jgi:hypothetical protein
MIIHIPVGRIAQWAEDMKHGYSPLPEGDAHAFLNGAGLIWEEAKKYGGPVGDPWCRFCGRHARKHPKIEYPVFVPPPEWKQVPEADAPFGALRPSGRPVRWPFLIFTDRGLLVYMYAIDENEAYRHTTDYVHTHKRAPVFVRLDLPVPKADGTCVGCGASTLVTTVGLNVWSPVLGLVGMDALKRMCASCSVRAYLSMQSGGEECPSCGGLGYTERPKGATECFKCQGEGLITRGPADPRFEMGSPMMPIQQGSSSAGEFKTCPDCAEEVRAASRKCRFCGYLFVNA